MALEEKVILTNTGQQSEGAGRGACSEDLGLHEGFTAPITPVWLMLSTQAMGTF